VGVITPVSVIFQFVGDGFFPRYMLIVVLILVPFILKAGFTGLYPTMKSTAVSTYKGAYFLQVNL